jgi:hypothetical protein
LDEQVPFEKFFNKGLVNVKSALMLNFKFGFNQAINSFLSVSEVKQKQRKQNEFLFSFEHFNKFY